jgi:cytochrome P450
MGNDAIGGTLTFGVRWLLNETGQGRERLPQKNWDRISDDMLRQTAVVDFLTRVASKEVRLGDFTLPPGGRVMASLLSSDHDQDQFGPDAGAISPDHQYGTGLAFGAGRHLCLGMQLARKIVHAGLGALSELPPMRSAGPTKQAAGKIVRTLSSVPVSFV